MTPTATGILAQWKSRFHSYRVYSCFDTWVRLGGLGERSHGGTSTVSLEHYLETPITVGSCLTIVIAWDHAPDSDGKESASVCCDV